MIDKEVDFKSIIVFSNRCTLKEITLNSPEIKVINRYHVAETVMEFLAETKERGLDAETISVLYEKLYPFTQVDGVVKEQHIQNVRIFTSGTERNEGIKTNKQIMNDKAGSICPKCGSKMTLRTAQKGQYAGKQFWGCTNYPKCRYIQNIN